MPPAASTDCEALCDAYEQAWRAGPPPQLEAYLSAYTGDDRPRLLLHLLELDLDYRLRAGEQPAAESYLARFPGHAAAIEQAFAQLSPVGGTRGNRGGKTQPQLWVGGRAPSNLGSYELLDELGRGGMGIVFRARQRSLNRLVALKLIRSGELAGGEELQRFRREAEAAAALAHEAIVPVYEVGEDQGFVFFSMGLVEGGSLADLVAEAPLPERRAAELVEQIARGVEYAHRQGVIHRDLKPANILLDPQGRPKITDFGLAKRLRDENELTTTGQVLGTPAYMPPEQARGELSAIGPAGDVYSLGAIFYRLVTGRAPFQAAAVVDTLHDVLTAEPAPPRSLAPGLAPDLETICLKCLEKAAAKRYASAAELADDLQRWRSGEPIRARRSTALERGWKWARRNPALASLSAALFAALLVGVLVSALFAADANQQAERERTARITAQSETTRANQALADLKRERAEVERQKQEVQKRNVEVERQKAEIQKQLQRASASLYAVQIGRAQRELELGNLAESQRVLGLTDPAQRGWEHDYLTAQNERLYARVEPVPPITVLCFSEDDRWLAASNPVDVVAVLDTQTGEVVAQLKQPPSQSRATGQRSEIQQLLFSPDGKLLISRDKWDVHVWDWRERKLVHVIPCHRDEFIPWQAALSRQGDRIAVGFQGAVIEYELLTGKKLLRRQLPQTMTAHGLDYSPSGEQLVCFAQDLQPPATPEAKPFPPLHYLIYWPRDSDQSLPWKAVDVADFPLDQVQYHPSGERVLFGGGRVRQFEKQGLVRQCRETSGFSRAARYADGGRLICNWESSANVGDGRMRQVRCWDAETLQQLWSLPIGVSDNVALSPSGAWLAVFAEKRIQLFDLRARTGRDTFQIKCALALAWYPDNERLAAVGEETGVVWDARTKAAATTAHFTGPPLFADVAVSSDGKFVVTAQSLYDNPTGKGLILRDAETWRPLHEWPQGAYDACFHPNGKQLISNTPLAGQLTLWNLETRQAERKLPGGVASALSPDGRWLAVNVDKGRLEVWDLQQPGEKPAATHTWGESYLLALGFAADSARLVFPGAEPGMLQVWNHRTNELERRPTGHALRIEHLCFSPDGKRLVTVAGGAPPEDPNREGEVKLWDFENGVELLSLPQPGWWPRTAAFSPNGKRLAVGGQSGAVHVWTAR